MAIPYSVFLNGTTAPSIRLGWAVSMEELEGDDLIDRAVEYAVVGPHPDPTTGEPPVTDRDVKRVCAGMIERHGYRQHDQLNILRRGDAVEIAGMDAFINRMIECSRILRAMSPIPADFRDPKYWT